MSQSRKPYAVRWTYQEAPSQRVLVSDRGRIYRRRSGVYWAFAFTGTTTVNLGAFSQRKQAIAAVESYWHSAVA